MHLLRYAALLLASTIGALGVEVTASVNATDMQNAADQLLSMFPSATPYTANFTVPGGNLIQPPSSLVGAIITAVPPTVLAQLFLPSGRSSIASEFQAGNTPSWYEELPSDVKSYVLAIRSQVGAGDVDLSATPTPTASAESGDDSSSEADSDSDSDSPATETSSGLAARATGEVAGSLVGVLGLLGLAVML